MACQNLQGMSASKSHGGRADLYVTMMLENTTLTCIFKLPRVVNFAHWQENFSFYVMLS